MDVALSWRDSCLAVRDRLLANVRFRRWATAFLLTRPIARRRVRALFDLCAGFVYSQILTACVRLGVFELLAEGPRTVGELSQRFSLPRDATERLLAAATSLRLLDRRGDDRFGLGELGAALVGNPGIAAMVEHHALLYRDLADPIALLRGEGGPTELAGYWPYAAGSGQQLALAEEQVAAYSALMSASQPLVAAEILDAYPPARHRCLLDVGGGEGAFLIAAAERASRLRLILFDLPAVADRARARFATAGLAERATTVGGNFLGDPLPRGADIASLVRVIHDHDDASAFAILRAVRCALPADGVLLLAEPMSGAAGAEPVGDAYFGFYLLAMGRGRPRTPVELQALARAAGFSRLHIVATHTPALTQLIVAHV